MLARPIKALTDINEKIQRGMAAAHSVFELLDMPEEKNTGTLTDSLKGDIEFKDVNLIYDDGHHAIHDFNLQVKAGETVALVGRSGAGKKFSGESARALSGCNFWADLAGSETD